MQNTLDDEVYSAHILIEYATTYICKRLFKCIYAMGEVIIICSILYKMNHYSRINYASILWANYTVSEMSRYFKTSLKTDQYTLTEPSVN